MTTEIQTRVDWLVANIISISGNKHKLQASLLELEEEMRNSILYNAIQKAKTELTLLEKREEELREQGKQQMIAWDFKVISLLSGMTVQLNASPGALKIEDESKVPDEYFKEKVTRSVDKIKLKEDIKQGIYVEGVSIETDYKFIIKS